MFYWIVVHHWEHGNEEKIFGCSRIGKMCLEDYMWEKVDDGWTVVQLKVMNRKE